MNYRSDEQMFRVNLESIRKAMLYIIVFSLPFTQLFTIKVGFPLKIYEIVLFLAVFIVVIQKRVVINLKKTVIVQLFAFSLIGIVSIILNTFDWYSYPLSSTVTRFGYFFDSVLKYIYFLLCVIAFLLLYPLSNNSKSKLLQIYLVGGYVASIFSIYFFVSSGLGLPIISFPGYEPQGVFIFIRNGTFKEGNYMAAYILTCLGISFHKKKYKSVFFFYIALFTTISTAGIVTGFMLGVLNYFRFNVARTISYKKILIGLSIVLIFGGISTTPIFKEVIASKISLNFDQIDSNKDFSRVERANQTKVAYRIGMANPLLGVGPSNYARHYANYNKDKRFTYDTSFKPISNNVYAEIFSEWGVLALLIYILFSLTLVKHIDSRILKVTYLLLMLYFIAFPTFTLMFIWVFAALAVKPPIKLQHDIH